MSRSKFIKALLISALVLTTGMSTAFAEEWEDLGVRDGVRVSRMHVSGSDMFAFRGEIEVDLHIGKIATVFLDPTQREHWVDRYHSHGTLERGNNVELYWIRFKLPMGVSDRDYVMRSEVTIDQSARVLTNQVRSVEDSRRPENKCCVRAITQTHYDFRPVPGQEKTRLIVEVHTDPKGRLPAAMVNRIQSDWPSKTLGGLIKRASESGVAIHPDFQDWHE